MAAPTQATTKTPPKPVPPSNGVWTTDLWAAYALHQANLPVTQNNIDNMKSWINAETGTNQGPLGWARDNNPLNMTGYGSTPPDPSSGHYFYTFPSLADAADVFAQFMKQSNMAPIRAALAQNAPKPLFGAAIGASPWGTGYTIAGTPPIDAKPVKSTSTGPTPGVVGQIFGTLGLPGGGVVGDALSATGITDLTGAAGSTVNALSSVGTLASDLINPNFWKRVGVFFFGVVFIVAGTVIFISTTPTARRVTSEASEAGVAAATKGAL